MCYQSRGLLASEKWSSDQQHPMRQLFRDINHGKCCSKPGVDKIGLSKMMSTKLFRNRNIICSCGMAA